MKRNMICFFGKIILIILSSIYIEINSQNELEALGNNFLIEKNNNVKKENKGN